MDLVTAADLTQPDQSSLTARGGRLLVPDGDVRAGLSVQVAGDPPIRGSGSRAYRAVVPPGSAGPLPPAGGTAAVAGLTGALSVAAVSPAGGAPLGDDGAAACGVRTPGGILAISPSTTASAAIPAASASRRCRSASSSSRIIGEVTAERLETLREADWIVIDEIKAAGLYRSVWQSFAIHTPVRSVGVMGDGRTYANVVAVRAVTSEDGMTADWAKLPYDVLARISSRIVNEVPNVNRVVYDISSKPPATIEWE